MAGTIASLPTMRGRVPLLGHLPRIARDALGCIGEAAAELGPMFWIDMGFGAKILLTTTEPGFAVFKNKYGDSSHLGEYVALVLGQSMLVVDGPDHRRARGATSPAFTPGGLKRARVGEILAETIEQHLRRWSSPALETSKVLVDTKELALEVIFRVMGIEGEELPTWRKQYDEFVLGAINIPINLPGFPVWRATRARAWLEEHITAIIDRTRAAGDDQSLVGAMVHGRDDSGEGLQHQELLDNVLVLAFAGHETTASTMAWAMLHLAREPEIWDRLVDQARGLDGLPTSFAELVSAVPLAEGIFRESLRLYPPVNLDSRRTHTPFELMGHTMEPGTVVGSSLLHLSRDPDRYPDPDRWNPQRWLERDRKPSPIENCQFGGGPHFCLGYHMAMLEGVMFLVAAAQTLSARGVRPAAPDPASGVPRPRYLPLTRPPAGATIRFEKT